MSDFWHCHRCGWEIPNNISVEQHKPMCDEFVRLRKQQRRKKKR